MFFVTLVVKCRNSGKSGDLGFDFMCWFFGNGGKFFVIDGI